MLCCVGYSQAVIVDKTMYISGFVGFDPATMELVPGGVGPQTEQVGPPLWLYPPPPLVSPCLAFLC